MAIIVDHKEPQYFVRFVLGLTQTTINVVGSLNQIVCMWRILK